MITSILFYSLLHHRRYKEEQADFRNTLIQTRQVAEDDISVYPQFSTQGHLVISDIDVLFHDQFATKKSQRDLRKLNHDIDDLNSALDEQHEAERRVATRFPEK